MLLQIVLLFQKYIYHILFVGLTNEQLKEMKEAFKLFDRDKSETIDVTELRDAMKALGINLNRTELKQMMKTVDKDKSGEIDFNEFKDLMTAKM